MKAFAASLVLSAALLGAGVYGTRVVGAGLGVMSELEHTKAAIAERERMLADLERIPIPPPEFNEDISVKERPQRHIRLPAFMTESGNVMQEAGGAGGSAILHAVPKARCRELTAKWGSRASVNGQPAVASACRASNEIALAF